MKVVVRYTVEVDGEYRAALALRYGQEGLATRELMQQHFEAHGRTLDSDVRYAYAIERATRATKALEELEAQRNGEKNPPEPIALDEEGTVLV
jgi:hypothetical protein